MTEVDGQAHPTASLSAFKEGIDFFGYDKAYDVARKLIRASFTKFSATGARASACSIGLVSRRGEWLNEFINGYKYECGKLRIKLLEFSVIEHTVGAVFITMFGEADGIFFPGAKPGDLLCVSGLVGDAAMGLSQRACDNSAKFIEYFDKKYSMPDVRVKLGFMIRNLATCCFSTYNGFLHAAQELANFSQVSLCIKRDDIPISSYAHTINELMISGGGDCELMFSIPQDKCHVVAMINEPISIIGTVLEGPPKITVE